MTLAEKPMKFRFLVTVEVVSAEDQNPAVDGPLLRRALYDAAYECMDRPEGCGMTVQLLNGEPDIFGFLMVQIEDKPGAN
jgi:hypothetical protein